MIPNLSDHLGGRKGCLSEEGAETWKQKLRNRAARSLLGSAHCGPGLGWQETLMCGIHHGPPDGFDTWPHSLFSASQEALPAPLFVG